MKTLLQAKMVLILAAILASVVVIANAIRTADRQNHRTVTQQQKRAVDSMGTVTDRKEYLPK